LSDDPQTDATLDTTKYDLTNRIVLNAGNVATIVNDVNHNRIPDPGDSIGYTVTIKNIGTVAATNVVFNDTPDINAPLVVSSVTTSIGTDTHWEDSRRYTNTSADWHDLLPDGSVTIRLYHNDSSNLTNRSP
jgi:uncharacterized repeat protein (TIGR01451 family)